MSTPPRPEDPAADLEADRPTPDPVSAPTDAFFTPLVFAEPALSGTFGRYTIVRVLGQGGMGRVYLAHDGELDRHVALKVPQLGPGGRDAVRERFSREARAAARLHHPNICAVHDVGCVGETPYLTMAYIDGPGLHEWARAGRPVATMLDVVRKVALALDEAHAHGIIHRDLKPSNVMIDRRGEPVVMDFGLARQTQLPDGARLTAPGLILGTPAYMPPEAVLGHEPTPAGDVYSLGVVLYELLAGRCPYLGSITAILAQIVTEPPAPPSSLRPDLDPRLDAVCLKALARKPEARYARMADFASALAAASPTARVEIRGAPAPRDEPPPTQVGMPDTRLAPRILEMLRQWGWARSVQKMRNKAQRAEGEGQRRAWQGFLDWMAGERSDDAKTVQSFQALPQGKALRGWALVGQASHLLRDRDHAGARIRLERAEAEGDASDPMLQATIAHTRGAVLVHQGQCDPAMPHLHRALDLFGRDHFMTGRVLDTLGMAHAYKGNRPLAQEFYEQSIRYKRRYDDEAGIAISHGQLGRLYLSWGELDRAESHFQEDLRIAQKLRSRWSEAQIYNHLGQVALARGVKELEANRRAAGRRHLQSAAGWLDESIRLCLEGKYPVSEGFARKDRALVYLHEGDLNSADEQARQSAALFASGSFAEGAAKVHLVEGMVLREREKWADAERKFRASLAHFEATQEAAEIITCYREIARTRRDAGSPLPLVTRAYCDALTKAESYRHDPLVRDIEQELHEVDLEAYLRHVYRRARGQGIDEDAPSLLEGVAEVGTVLFIDLPGFADYAQGMDAQSVLVTFNHLMADFADVLRRHQAAVLAYRGNGLMAMTRDARHADRAVAAALELASALEEFNRPRELLGLTRFAARVGIASGDVTLGNVGTYQKMDFTALGATVNLAGALRNEARPGVPLVARGTREMARERFAYGEEARKVNVAGAGVVEAWEVVGR